MTTISIILISIGSFFCGAVLTAWVLSQNIETKNNRFFDEYKNKQKS
jgi:hypothetical protein